MHYSFIISERQGQIDLHFEPSPVFSDIVTISYYNPQVLGDTNDNVAMSLFPYERGMIERMIHKFECREFCGKNLPVLIIRVHESNSANYGIHQTSNLEECILSEFLELGLVGCVIDSDRLKEFCINENSLLGTGNSM